MFDVEYWCIFDGEYCVFDVEHQFVEECWDMMDDGKSWCDI